MHVLHLVSTLILMACIVMLVIVNRHQAKRIKRILREQLKEAVDKADINYELHSVKTYPLIGYGSLRHYNWTIRSFGSGNGCYYRVIAECEYCWNRSRKLPHIIIKDFYYTPK